MVALDATTYDAILSPLASSTPPTQLEAALLSAIQQRLNAADPWACAVTITYDKQVSMSPFATGKAPKVQVSHAKNRRRNLAEAVTHKPQISLREAINPERVVTLIDPPNVKVCDGLSPK